MFPSIEQSFQSFTCNRTTQISNFFVSTDPEYINLSKKSLEYYEQIASYLPDEAKHLLSELDDSLNRLQSIVDDSLYLQGVKDGVQLYCLLTGQR